MSLYSVLRSVFCGSLGVFLVACSSGADSDERDAVQSTGQALAVTQVEDNGAIRFDGTDDNVVMDSEQDFDVGSGDFTLAAWIRVPTSVPANGGGTIAGKNLGGPYSSNGDGYPGYRLYMTYNRVGFRVSYGGTENYGLLPPTLVPRNRWMHVAGVRAGDKIALYYDGVKQGEMDIAPGANLDNSSPFAIGASHYWRVWDFWNGDVDDVVFMRRALDDQELASLTSLGPDLDDPDLYGFWAFDDGTPRDQGQTPHDGTLVADAAHVDDGATHAPTGMEFDGINDSLQLVNPNWLDFDAQDFTLSAWVWVPSSASLSGRRTILGKNLGASHPAYRGYRMYLDQGRPALSLSRGAYGESFQLRSSRVVPRETWVHVVGVRRDNSMTLYVDGEPEGARALPPGASFLNNSRFMIGTTNYPYGYTGHFGGRVDEVAVFDRALNFGEVRALHDLDQTPMQSGLRAHWRFDRASLLSSRAFPPPSTGYLDLVERYNPVLSPGIGVAQRDEHLGPFTIHAYSGASHGITFYVVSPGVGTSAEVRVESPNQAPGAAVDDALVRVFDPDEKLVNWSFYENLQTGAPTEIMTDVPSAGGPLDLSRPGVYQIRVTARGGNSRVYLDLPSGVGYGFSNQNGQTKIDWCPPNAPDCNGPGASPIMPSETWAWAPAHPTRSLFLQLQTANTLPTISRLDNGVLTQVVPQLVPNSDRYRYEVAPSATSTGELWKVDFGSNLNWAFTPTYMPFILCNSQDAATAIHASVERVSSGPYVGALVSHKFQVRAAELLPEVLAGIGSEDLFDGNAADGSSIATYPSREACAKPADVYSAYRHTDLLSSYDSGLAMARWGLGAFPFDSANQTPIQTTAANDFWAGSVGTPFFGNQTCELDMDCVNGTSCVNGQCSASFDPTQDRWDVLRPFTYASNQPNTASGPSLGLSMSSQAPAYWGLFATWSHPCNPYGPLIPNGAVPFPGLIHRAAAAAMANLMMVAEDETLHGVADANPYPGYMGFAMGATLPVYAQTAPHLRRVMTSNGLGDAVREVWADGLRHLIDRSYADNIVSSMNQSSFYVLAFEQFAQGSHDSELTSSPSDLPFADDYVGLTRKYVQRYQAECQRWSSAGWCPESLGPDSSYSGIQHNNLARYLRLSENDSIGPDPVARKVLRDSYYFFNRTVVEEPDGKRTSGFNMNHRIASGFQGEQWGGARGIVIDMAEVSWWNEYAFSTDAAAEANVRSVLASWANSFDARTRVAHNYGLGGAADIARYLTAPPIQFPTEPPPPDVDSEMHHFNNDTYSVSIYAGHPAPASHYFAGNWAHTRRIPLARQDSNGQWISIEDVAPNTSVPLSNGASVDPGKGSPMVGGGITILGSGVGGSAVIGTTWSPLAHHGLVAELSDGQRYWEEYTSVSRQPVSGCAGGFESSSAHDLSVFGRLEQSSICYARHYDFQPTGIEVLVELQGGSVTGSRLFENVPVPTCTRLPCSGSSINNAKSSGAELWDRATNAKLSGYSQLTSSAIDLRTGNGDPILGVEFVDASGSPETRGVATSADGLRLTQYSQETQVGRIEIELPTDVTSLTQLRYVLQLPQ